MKVTDSSQFDGLMDEAAYVRFYGASWGPNAGPLPNGPEGECSIQGLTDLNRDLPVRNFAVQYLSARFDNLKPANG